MDREMTDSFWDTCYAIKRSKDGPYVAESFMASWHEDDLADRRFAAWQRNHGWPQVSDNGKVA